MRTPILFLAAVSLLATSCVSQRKYKTALANADALRADTARTHAQVRDLSAQIYGLEDYAEMTKDQLAARDQQLKARDAELKEKARRMDELDKRLRAQSDAMTKLRTKVADALVGFQAEDLSVDLRDGKVYVSLSEKLLFASGSDRVEARGVEAIGQLRAVLHSSSDINVMVEGHTDSIPIHNAHFKDNWELSTARATSVARLLTSDGQVDPKRVSAAGRGEFVPIADNGDAVGRQRNRRTEVILIPQLEELYELVGEQPGK